jgi:hypothetical protein
VTIPRYRHDIQESALPRPGHQIAVKGGYHNFVGSNYAWCARCSSSRENRNAQIRSKQLEIGTIGGNDGCAYRRAVSAISPSF